MTTASVCSGRLVGDSDLSLSRPWGVKVKGRGDGGVRVKVRVRDEEEVEGEV